MHSPWAATSVIPLMVLARVFFFRGLGGVRYKDTRFWENIEKGVFPGVGPYDFPQIAGIPSVPDVDTMIGWNYAKGEKHPENKAVHFFVDDYQFNRLWTNPDGYIEMLRKFRYVLSPDFSPYADFPKAVQIFNHYRKHWIAAYLQLHGITVIPTITWSYKPSWEFCFDGEPQDSVVAVSSVGCLKSKEDKMMLIDGYYEMIERLRPTEILWYGTIPEECKGNIVRFAAYHEKFRKAICEVR